LKTSIVKIVLLKKGELSANFVPKALWRIAGTFGKRFMRVAYLKSQSYGGLYSRVFIHKPKVLLGLAISQELLVEASHTMLQAKRI